MTYPSLVVGVLAAIVACGPALTQEAQPLEAGATFTGSVGVAGKQVALPEGTWTLAGRGFAQVPELDADPYGAIETVILFRLAGSVIDAFVAASRNRVPVEEGWGTAGECLAEDVEMSVILNYDAAGTHTFCGFVGEVRNVITPASPTAWKAAAAYGMARDLTPAAEWLMAGYRLSDRFDVLDVRYHFNPALRTDAEGDLTPWLNRMREPVRIGFNNGLEGIAPMPMPWTEGAELPSPVIMAKLDRLTQLRQTGVLDEQQFRAQEALIQAQSPRIVATPISSELLTLYKTVAEQVTAAGPLFIGNFLILQNVTQATQLLGVQSLADFAHDYGVEYAWNIYGPQRLREEPIIDLPVAGVSE
jgi:hypothetical protein